MLKLNLKNTLILLLFTSVAALGMAYFGQYHYGLEPCHLCLLQRKPFFAIIAIVLLFLLIPYFKKYQKFAINLSVLILLLNAGIAFYHVGVQKEFFKASGSCSVNIEKTNDLDALLIALESKPAGSCNKIAFSFLGLSIPAWNFIYCLSLAIFVFCFGGKEVKKKRKSKKSKK